MQLSMLQPPAAPQSGTQTRQVLDALQRGPVCSFSFYDQATLTHRLAARIYDLKARGYHIQASACHRHNHGANAVEYRLLP